MSDETRFRQYLAYWGADVEAWPGNARAWGLSRQTQPPFADLIEKERRFERLLRERRFESAPTGLTQRILSAADSRRPGESWQFSDILTLIKPRAIAAMLAIGFVIGFGAVTPALHGHEETSIQYSDD